MESAAGFDPAVWRTMAEMGLPGLLIDEAYGGGGGNFGDVCVVAEEMGRALLCAPYLSSAVVATTALRLCADEDVQARWLPELAAGRLRATLATSAVAAAPDGGRWRVTGAAEYVLDGHTAQLLLVPGTTDAGLTLFAVDSSAEGVRAAARTTLDATRRLAHLEFESAAAVAVGRAGSASEFLPAVLDLSLVALSAEALGGAQRVLEMAVEYAKVREQFGKPIGSFQAIKHKCADMLTQIELSRSLTVLARDAAVAGRADLPMAARMAKAFGGDTFFACAAENIQVHGGIGFTWEHPAHLYFRRAKSTQVLFGSSRELRAQLARLLDEESAAGRRSG